MARLALGLGGVRSRPAVERLVEAHVESDAEQRQLDRAEGERALARPPHRAGGEEADHEAGGYELEAQPGQRAQQGEAAERRGPGGPGVEADREQGGAGQRGARAQLGIDGGAVGQERRAQPDRRGRADGPRVGHHVPGEPVGEHHRQRRQRGQKELDGDGAAEQPGGHEQEREADPEGLVEAPVGLLAPALEVVGIEVRVGALGVLVADVEVAVIDQRLDRQQIVRLVAAVVGVAEGVEAEGGRVDAEEHEP